MRQFTTAIYRLLYCGYVIMYLAACAPHQPVPTGSNPPEAAQPLSPPQLPAGKSALAIFPWSITGGFEDAISAEPEGLRAIRRGLSETNLIPTHSYYMLEETQLQRLTQKSHPELRRIWRGKNPNVDMIVQLGTQLGVKAVFIYDMDVSFGTDVLHAYIIDIETQQIYEAAGETWDFTEESYETLLGLARKVLTAYARDRA